MLHLVLHIVHLCLSLTISSIDIIGQDLIDVFAAGQGSGLSDTQ